MPTAETATPALRRRLDAAIREVVARLPGDVQRLLSGRWRWRLEALGETKGGGRIWAGVFDQGRVVAFDPERVVAATDEQLHTLIAHELAHVVARLRGWPDHGDEDAADDLATAWGFPMKALRRAAGWPINKKEIPQMSALDTLTARLGRCADSIQRSLAVLEKAETKAKTGPASPPARRRGFRPVRTKSSAALIPGFASRLVTIGGQTVREYPSLRDCEQERARLGCEGFQCVEVGCSCSADEECSCGH